MKRRLEDRRINWMFHKQSNILRTNESESMLQFVSTAFSCMNADQTYETWIKYFGIVPLPKPEVKAPQIAVVTKPLERSVYNYDYDTDDDYNHYYNRDNVYNYDHDTNDGSTNSLLFLVKFFMCFTLLTFIFVKVLESFYSFSMNPYIMIKYIIFCHKYLNTSEKRFQMSMALSSIVILICTCVYLMYMLIVSICNFVIYLISLLLSTIEFMILEFVDLISIVLSIPLLLIRECMNLIWFILGLFYQFRYC